MTKSTKQPVKAALEKMQPQLFQLADKEFMELLNSLDEYIFILAADCKVLFANSAAITALGYLGDEIISMEFEKLHPSNDVIRTLSAQGEITAGRLCILNSQLATKEGSRIPVKSRAYVDSVNKILVTCMRYNQANELFMMSFHHSKSPMSILDIDTGKYLDVNEAFLNTMGYKYDEVIGKTPFDIGIYVRPDDRPQVLEYIRQHGRIQNYPFEVRDKQGLTRYVLLSVDTLQHEGHNLFFVVMNDITEQKEFELMLKESEERYRVTFKQSGSSLRDGLTKLYNRQYFEQELTRIDEERQIPVSIIMGDINGLKLINDIFGHLQGDQILVEIAGILTSCCRQEDIVARIGGDEFCIILPGLTNADARSVGEMIYHDCETHNIIIRDEAFHPSIALGYSTRTDEDTCIVKVLIDAENYMFKRKLLEKKSVHSSLIASIRTTLLEKSCETKDHADRLVEYSKRIGQKLGLDPSQMFDLELLAQLHDIGKIGVDNNILIKPDRLTDEDWQQLRKHPESGYRIALASPQLVSIAEAILYHHERWDGKGYPRGLEGKNIPLLSRILSVVDAYDAMVNDRPYRKALSVKYSMKEISANSGLQFDPEIVNIFLDLL